MLPKVNRALLVVRVLLLFTVACFLAYELFPEVQAWVHDRWHGIHYGRFVDAFQDEKYTVPEADRVPKEATIAEFRANRDTFLQRNRVHTMVTFDQQTEGTVLTDGYNAALPPNSRWHNGVILTGKGEAEAYRQTIQKAKEKAKRQEEQAKKRYEAYKASQSE